MHVSLFSRMTATVPPMPAFDYDDCGQGWGWWGHGGMMDFSHGGVFMGLFSLIALVVLIYLIIQAAKHKPPATPSAETPLEILKKRYARGEVTKDQFDIMRKDLES